MYPLITRDPVSGHELIVTRLECPKSGIVIEGQFDLGWIGRLTREQLDFVELLVKNRGNIQKLAADLDMPTTQLAAAWMRLLPRWAARLKTTVALIVVLCWIAWQPKK